MFKIRSLCYPFYAPIMGLLLLLFPLQHPSYAQEWTLKREQNGIVLYESAGENKKEKKYMAVFTVAASLKSSISLLYHPQFHPHFMDGIATSELMGTPNAGSIYYYQVVDLPWPIPNRDMVTHAHFVVSTDYQEVIARMKSAPEEKEPTSMTRINVPDREWHFRKEGASKTQVVYYYTSDENIPAFLRELMSVDGPLKMIRRFRQLAEEKGHVPSGLAWIEE